MVTEATEQLSDVVGVPKFTLEASAEQVPASTVTDTGAAQVMLGSIVSGIVVIS